MKKTFILLILVLPLFYSTASRAFAQCRIEWWGDSSGWVSTDKTSRSTNACYEAFVSIFGFEPDFCEGNAGVYYCMSGTYRNLRAVSLDGTYNSYEINGNWDVVYETVIELSLFETSVKRGGVMLIWSTASEIDNAGFNLYRSETADGEYIKINDSLIPAQGFSTQGASYEYIDTGLRNRKTYYYKLEDIDLNGVSTFYGPVSATPRLIYKLRK